jgi:hypothetical protein
MQFIFKKPRENIYDLGRILGYQLIKTSSDQEYNLIKPLGRDYPRFHLYIKITGKNLVFNLHLDQKRPSYGRETAHSGEYEGKLVKTEKQRINIILEKIGS